MRCCWSMHLAAEESQRDWMQKWPDTETGRKNAVSGPSKTITTITSSISQSKKGALRQQSRKLKGPQGEERSKEKNGIQQEEDTHYPSVKKWWPAFWKGSGHEMCAKRNETHLPPKRWGRKNRHSTFPDGCLICPMLIVSEAFYWLFMGCGATDLPDKAVQSHFAFRDVTKRMHFIVIVALINPRLNLQCPSHTVSVYILITLLAIPKESFLSLY